MLNGVKHLQTARFFPAAAGQNDIVEERIFAIGPEPREKLRLGGLVENFSSSTPQLKLGAKKSPPRRTKTKKASFSLDQFGEAIIAKNPNLWEFRSVCIQGLR